MKLKTTTWVAFFLALSTFFSYSQNQTISGTVTDSGGVPLSGVTVLIQGTTTGVISDFDGNYSISAKVGDVLKFTFVGMQAQSITVGSSTTVNIVMRDDVESLDAVVVTGYQNVRRDLFTGASQTIKAADVKLEGTPDISRALEGRAAGVSVQNVSGTFGTAPRITIRGSSSILGDTKPIWIIDGVIQEEIVNLSVSDLVSGDANTLLSSAVAGLNPSDIESFEILKDASATALYGARALNGVVVITTKSGLKNQKPKLTYSSEYAVREIPRYNNYDILNSQETVSIYREMERKGFLDMPSSFQGRYGGIYNIMYRAINTFDEKTGKFQLANTPVERAKFLQQFELANTNWFKTLFNAAPTQTHTLSFSGGGENSTSYSSLSYYTDGGWTVADRVRRITGNINNSYFFGEGGRSKVTTQLQASIRDQNAPGTFSRQGDNVYGTYTRDFDINPFSYALNTSRALRAYDNNGDLEYSRYNWAPFNILKELQNNKLNLKVSDIKFQGQFEHKIKDDFKYNFLGSARYVTSNGSHSITENSNVVAAYRANETTIVENQNVFLFKDPDKPNSRPQVVLPYGGILNTDKNTLTSYTFRNTLDYSTRFNEVHGIRLYGGQEYRYADRSYTSNTGYGYQFNNGGTVFTDPNILRKLILAGRPYFSFQEYRQREVSFFGNLTYDYDRKYVLNLTGNYEGSNRAGKSKDARWLPTYTIGGRWNIDKENFLANSKVISSMAFRPSYGLVGLLADAASNNLPVFRNRITDRTNDYERENFINIDDLQNSELTWEKTLELNFGLDTGFFNNRITTNIDVYFRKGIDLIDYLRTSGIGGQSYKLGNNSEMKTNGVEFQINATNITNDNFTWKTGLNFSYFKQEITKLKQKSNVFDLVTAEGYGNVIGKPKGALFSFDFQGLNEYGLPKFLTDHPDYDPSKPFDLIDFRNKEDLLDYLVYEGPTLPNLTGGINNTFTYKNWDFSFFISYSGGNKIRLNPAYSSVYNDLSVFPKEFVNRWLQPGDENKTNVPVIASKSVNEAYGYYSTALAYNAYNYSTERVADGDFLRMKSITLAYNLDKPMVERLGLNTVRFSLQSTNPFLIYSDKKLGGQDPEFFKSGGVAFPLSKLYTFTLNVGF